MAIVQNYGAQNYNPPMVQAIPARNWFSQTSTLASGSIATLLNVDLIQIFRGGPLATASIPAGQLNLRLDLNCDQSGINLDLQEDLGDTVMQPLTPASIICGAGLTRIVIGVSGFLFRARGTRIASALTTITLTVSFVGY